MTELLPGAAQVPETGSGQIQAGSESSGRTDGDALEVGSGLSDIAGLGVKSGLGVGSGLVVGSGLSAGSELEVDPEVSDGSGLLVGDGSAVGATSGSGLCVVAGCGELVGCSPSSFIGSVSTVGDSVADSVPDALSLEFGSTTIASREVIDSESISDSTSSTTTLASSSGAEADGFAVALGVTDAVDVGVDDSVDIGDGEELGNSSADAWSVSSGEVVGEVDVDGVADGVTSGASHNSGKAPLGSSLVEVLAVSEDVCALALGMLTNREANNAMVPRPTIPTLRSSNTFAPSSSHKHPPWVRN